MDLLARIPEQGYLVESAIGMRPAAISQEELVEMEDSGLPIGKAQIDEADEQLNKYRAAKQQMDARFMENEKWWRMQHVNQVVKEKASETDTSSGWLFNSVANKHADAMDNFPTASVLPREASDRDTAQMLSNILPVVLERCDFEKTYSEAWDYKLKMGMCCYYVHWDNSLMNGIGDVNVQKVDLLNLYWEPGVTDLQDSRNVFYTYLVDTDILEQEYPELKGKLGGVDTKTAQYAFTDNIDYENKSAVVDWYYRQRNSMGKDVLHMCKYCGGHVLYATENDPETAERGFYNHGKYPFVIDRLHCMEGTLEAFGYVDVCKPVQTRIDRQQCALTAYAAEAMDVRWFTRDGANINKEQYADHKQKFVNVANSGLGQEDIRQIEVKPIDSIWVQVLNNNIEELKETSGNRDVNQGGTTSGVTAASGIAAMMEAGSKLSRDMIKAGYRAYQQICYLVLENIRQFYTEDRAFRIVAPDGGMQFVSFNNRGMVLEDRLPIFDIIVKAQKNSPYSRMAQNELVKEFYNLGFFNPAMVDQSMMAMQMMDFDGKEEMLQMISKNGTMYQKLQTLQSVTMQLAETLKPEDRDAVMQGLVQQGLLDGNMMPKSIGGNAGGAPAMNSLGAVEGGGSVVEKARSAARDSTAPI